MTDLLSPPAAEPASELLPRPPLLLVRAAICYALAYLLWSRFGGASNGVRELMSEGVFLPLIGTLAVVDLAAARRAGPALRRALYLLAATAALLVVGNLVVVGTLLTRGKVPSASLADVCYVAGYPLTLLALISIPGFRRTSDRWKLVCDGGMVLAGSGLALWYFILRPIAASATSQTAVAMALVYPLGDLLVLVGIVSILFRRPAEGNHRAITWLAIGAALSIVADVAFNLMVARTGSRYSLVIDALYMATYISMLASAELFWRQPTSLESRPQGAMRARLRLVLPFVTAGATYALLLIIAVRDWVAPLSGAAIGAVAVSLFLGARQLLSYRSNTAILAEAAMRASEARFRSLVQHSSDLIFLLDARGLITFASSSASRELGYEPEALVGEALATLVHPDDVSLVTGYVELAAARAGVSPATEWRLRRRSGEMIQVEVIASNMLGDERVSGIVLNARDIGERKALLDQLAHQAFHDPLTGLANRALFYDRVSHALALAHRQGRTVLALFLDLDDFKQVNDTLGHAEGDRLLTMIAARLRACARSTDTVARLGGDEFAVLVEDQSGEGAERLIERIREQMRYPFSLAGTDVTMSASIGGAIAHGGSVDDIVRHADLAMYAAKRAEKGSYQKFETGMIARRADA
ncbi:MAG: diguanylate cyclase [Gemmatimonadetes bacterium]|nr:diguanylate cyclase [Gemmatimonadota bacterium]